MRKKLIKNLDFTLIGVTILLNIISLFMIGSATHVNGPTEDRFWYLQRQAIFMVFNYILVFLSLDFNYNSLKNIAKPLYIFNLLVLFAVLFFGHSALGAQRWIQLGPISLQPSEFSKIIMIVALANFIDNRKDHMQKPVELLPIFVFVFLPALIVMRQPDLGTSLVFFAVTLGMIYIAGINIKFLMSMFGIGIAMLPIFWTFLQDYQKLRIKVFMDPNLDPLGSGYHVIQSKIAIGSGLLTGKGLFGGTQSQLNFLPENHTDFIFAVVGEELGFVGATIVIILYGILIYRGYKIALEAKDDFGALIAIGIISMFIFHILVNVGMTTGVMPVTGIPLPFMSYGVSALTTNMLCVGLLLNIGMRRKTLMF